MKFLYFITLMSIALPSSADYQNSFAKICLDYYKNNTQSVANYAKHYNIKKDFYYKSCDEEKLAKNFKISSHAEVGIVDALTAQGGGSYALTTDNYKKICEEMHDYLEDKTFEINNQVLIETSAYKSFNQCMNIATQSGNTLIANIKHVNDSMSGRMTIILDHTNNNIQSTLETVAYDADHGSCSYIANNNKHLVNESSNPYKFEKDLFITCVAEKEESDDNTISYKGMDVLINVQSSGRPLQITAKLEPYEVLPSNEAEKYEERIASLIENNKKLRVKYSELSNKYDDLLNRRFQLIETVKFGRFHANRGEDQYPYISEAGKYCLENNFVKCGNLATKLCQQQNKDYLLGVPIEFHSFDVIDSTKAPRIVVQCYAIR